MAAGEFRVLHSSLAGARAVEAASRYSFPRHAHDEFGIGVIWRGAQTSLSGRGQVEAQAGDVLSCNPGEVHDGAPIGEAGRSWRMVYLEPEVVSAAAADLERERGEFVWPVLRDAATARLAARLFAAVTGEGGPPAEELLLAVLDRAMAERPRRAGPAPAVAIARRRIDDDPAAAVSLAELAALCGLSRFQVLRGFVRATGLTPHAYLVQRRLARARQAIARGVPLAEAALAAGFADQSHMTRVFARTFGFTPGAFRRACG